MLRLKSRNRPNFFEVLIAVYYTWYFLPVLRGLFSSTFYKNLFFGIFVVGLIGVVMLQRRPIVFKKLTILILIYCGLIFVLSVFGVGDASKHLRVSLIFWETPLLTLLVLEDDQKKRLCKYMTLLLVVTVVTSAIGVTTNERAARTLSYSKTDDDLQVSIKLKNISSIYLFQCFAAFVPVIVALTDAASKRFVKVMGVVLIVLLLLVVINASFAISFFIFLISVALTYSGKYAKGAWRFVIPFAIIGALLVVYRFSDEILTYLIRTVPNTTIVHKLTVLKLSIAGEGEGFSGLSRFKLYGDSWNTFIQHPMGVGPRYAFLSNYDGLGYHSQILDDLARYGVVGLIFYVFLFWHYYKLLLFEWGKINAVFVASTVTVIYALLLLLNIGLKSAEEGVVFWLIIPVLPSIVCEMREKKMMRNGFNG